MASIIQLAQASIGSGVPADSYVQEHQVVRLGQAYTLVSWRANAGFSPDTRPKKFYVSRLYHPGGSVLSCTDHLFLEKGYGLSNEVKGVAALAKLTETTCLVAGGWNEVIGSTLTSRGEAAIFDAVTGTFGPRTALWGPITSVSHPLFDGLTRGLGFSPGRAVLEGTQGGRVMIIDASAAPLVGIASFADGLSPLGFDQPGWLDGTHAVVKDETTGLPRVLDITGDVVTLGPQLALPAGWDFARAVALNATSALVPCSWTSSEVRFALLGISGATLALIATQVYSPSQSGKTTGTVGTPCQSYGPLASGRYVTATINNGRLTLNRVRPASIGFPEVTQFQAGQPTVVYVVPTSSERAVLITGTLVRLALITGATQWLRQRQRDDLIRARGTARNVPTSRQASIRQGHQNTYT